MNENGRFGEESAPLAESIRRLKTHLEHGIAWSSPCGHFGEEAASPSNWWPPTLPPQPAPPEAAQQSLSLIALDARHRQRSSPASPEGVASWMLAVLFQEPLRSDRSKWRGRQCCIRNILKHSEAAFYGDVQLRMTCSREPSLQPCDHSGGEEKAPELDTRQCSPQRTSKNERVLLHCWHMLA